jgi:hypothetical protein
MTFDNFRIFSLKKQKFYFKEKLQKNERKSHEHILLSRYATSDLSCINILKKKNHYSFELNYIHHSQ